MTSRALLLALFFALLMGGMIVRLFQLQILEGGRLATAVDDSRVISELLPATRGRILDRHGVAIADNRSAYHIGVVLADLELASKPRRDLPFYRLDEQRFDELVADLVARLPPGRPNPRETLLRELLAHPGVAIRYGSRTHDTALTLIAVPRQSLAPSGDDDGTGEPSNAAILAQSDLLCEDPRDALVREIRQRWDQKAECFTPGEFRAAAVALDQRFGVTTERCFNVLDAFAPVVVMPATADGGPEQRWHLLTDERRAQAEAALGRFLGLDPQHIHDPFTAALGAVHEPPPRGPFLYAAAANAQEIASLMPGASFSELPLDGVPAARERVFIIQGDLPGDGGGLFRQLQDRLAASFGSPEQGDWVGALIERHGEKVRARTCERLYRLHQLALDPVRIERLCSSLAALLTGAGLPTTALDVSQYLALARRIADRQQQNQTHNDPITIVHDIPHRLAITLDGANALMPRDLTQQYDETETSLPGVTVQIGSGREYPFPGSSSHIIGLIGRVDPNLNTQTALALGVDPNGWQGHTGLEAHYDSVLRGVTGSRRRLRGPNGYSTPQEEPPIAGQDLTTELDMELQLLAEDSLVRWYDLAQNMGTATDKMNQARAVGNGRAGCVLMDCNTGALLVLASSPGYGIDDLRRHYAELNDPKKSPGQPLHDYASEASQPPGSCMKILTALAALEDQVITPGEELNSPGYMALTKSGQKILRDHAPAGTYDLPKAIQFSCNIYFAKVGERLGGERMASYFRMFGMGENNALDVDQQRPGILPRPDTVAVLRKSEPHWLPSDSWRMAIGQFLSASPLQVVTIAAAVANGGHVVSPYLVKPAGMPVVKDLKIRKEYLAEIQHGMELVTDNREGATAKYLLLEGAAEGIKVAAKTGTSEWGSPASRESGRTPDNAWLIGYAPAENPVIAFAIFIHSGTSGGRACSPVAKRLLEAYFSRYGRGGHLHPTPLTPGAPAAAPEAPKRRHK